MVELIVIPWSMPARREGHLGRLVGDGSFRRYPPEWRVRLVIGRRLQGLRRDVGSRMAWVARTEPR